MSAWKHVPIENIVPAEILQRSAAFNFDQYIFDSTVRGLPLRWLAPSKRLLWMAAGPEYIEPELLIRLDRSDPEIIFLLRPRRQ